MDKEIDAILRRTAAVHEALTAQSELIAKVGRRLSDVLAAGGRLYVMGNGGSAADSQHMAGELVGRFLKDRTPLPCQAFTADTSVLTALANDYGVDEVFAKQVDAFVRPGDAVIGISTSGNSVNVNRALERARQIGAITIGLCGRDGGEMAKKCDLAVTVPADETPRIQEAHGTIIHILCGIIEKRFSAD